jgi:TRAP-type C4-dicarboxylate transport system permease small subunit
MTTVHGQAEPSSAGKSSQKSRPGGTFGAVLTMVGVLALLVLIFQTILSVAARHLFSSPLPATTEWAQFWYLPLIVFVGALVAQFKHEHIDATLLYEKLQPGQQREYRVFGNALSATTCLLLTYFSLLQTQRAYSIGLKAGFTDIQVWPVLAIMTAVFASLAFLWGREAFRDIASTTSFSRKEFESV